jgi:hypothetical protein
MAAAVGGEQTEDPAQAALKELAVALFAAGASVRCGWGLRRSYVHARATKSRLAV